jgi:hypothetical protein
MLRDQLLHEALKSVNEKFSEDFIVNITQTNRAKLVNEIRFQNFGD